jgi:hypothetical protein
LGVYSIPDYLSYCNASDLLPPNLNTSIVFTAVLNLGLGAIIVYKLYWSRRSIAAYTHNCRQTSWHTRLMAFIIESALLWVVTAFLNIVTTVEDTFGDAAPFFDLLFIITTVRRKRGPGQDCADKRYYADHQPHPAYVPNCTR